MVDSDTLTAVLTVAAGVLLFTELTMRATTGTRRAAPFVAIAWGLVIGLVIGLVWVDWGWLASLLVGVMGAFLAMGVVDMAKSIMGDE